MNPSTRRHPRTLQEAFGPYATYDFKEPPVPWTLTDLLIAIICVAAIAFAVWQVVR